MFTPLANSIPGSNTRQATRSPLVDLLPEAQVKFFSWYFSPFNIGQIANNQLPLARCLARFTPDTIGDDFALAGLHAQLFSGNSTGADIFGYTALDAAYFMAPWGDGGGPSLAMGAPSAVVIDRNPGPAVDTWYDYAGQTGGLFAIPTNPNMAPPTALSDDTIAVLHPPQGDWSTAALRRDVERSRSFDADPIRISRGSCLTVSLVLPTRVRNAIVASGQYGAVGGHFNLALKLRKVTPRYDYLS